MLPLFLASMRMPSMILDGCTWRGQRDEQVWHVAHSQVERHVSISE
jgi:hypothetical protein